MNCDKKSALAIFSSGNRRLSIHWSFPRRRESSLLLADFRGRTELDSRLRGNDCVGQRLFLGIDITSTIIDFSIRSCFCLFLSSSFSISPHCEVIPT